MPDRVAVRMAGYQRGATVQLIVDGRTIAAHDGEMLAAALMAAGLWRLRTSPRKGTGRGAFCLMGVCQECAIFVDGRLQQACRVEVRDGMHLELRGAP